MSNLIGTTVYGLRLPIITPGDDIKTIITDILKDIIVLNNINFKDNDIIAITESLVARAYNNYVSVNDIAEFIKNKYGTDATIGVLWPIYSRNRFGTILKGIARGAKHVIIQLNTKQDEVGNHIENKWTGIDIEDYYSNIVREEGADVTIIRADNTKDIVSQTNGNVIVCNIHKRNHTIIDLYTNYKSLYSKQTIITLADIFHTVSDNHGYNEEFGLLGSNKCGDEILKLFPTLDSCKEVCEYIRKWVKDTCDKDIHVMVYGDGCFKDPVAGIWEFADPTSCPYHTGTLLSKSPNEIKIKYIVDNVNSDPEEIKELIRNKQSEIESNSMLAQGTTPRRYYDLVASLCDLTSGSGDKGTPVIWIQNYFKNYADE